MSAGEYDEFYEDDESIEELRDAWNAGEKGTTSGPRNLPPVLLQVVDSGVTAITYHRRWPNHSGERT